MNFKKQLISSALLTAFGFSAPVLASPIAIVNSSFEDTVLPATFDINSFVWSISGWDAVGYQKAGVMNTVGGESRLYPGGNSDGSNVAYSEGGAGSDISQTLTTSLTDSTTYNLGVSVGHRLDNWGGSVFDSTIELLAGGTVIASVHAFDPGLGNFGLVNLSYTSGQNDTYAGLLLGIKFVTGGGLNELQVSYDAVTLNSNVATVPVPAAIWLFGSALAGFIGFNRRKQQAV